MHARVSSFTVLYEDGTEHTFTVDSSWNLVPPKDDKGATGEHVADAMRAVRSFVGHALGSATNTARGDAARRRLLALPPSVRKARASKGGMTRWAGKTDKERRAFADRLVLARKAKQAAREAEVAQVERERVLAELGVAPGARHHTGQPGAAVDLHTEIGGDVDRITVVPPTADDDGLGEAP